MVAVSRFVEFSATGQTFVTGATTDTGLSKGTKGYSRGTGLGAGDDSFTIVLNSNDQIAVNINGLGANNITLSSGTDLDPRFVARDIGFKLHGVSSNDAYKFAQCEWRNGGGGPNSRNSFIIYSGLMGANGGTNDVNVTDPGTGRDARATLGFGSVSEAAGIDFATTFGGSSYTGALVPSGSYGGQFDDTYLIMISDSETTPATATPGGGNTYAGTPTVGGIYTGTASDTYTITISTTAGSSMGLGSGNVPTFTVADAPGSDDNGTSIELLYVDHWYDVGNLGVRIKFSDAVFGNGDTFEIVASPAAGSGYPKAVGAAKYIFTSSQEDSSLAHSISAVTTQTTGTQVGTRGVTVSFSNSGTLSLAERFRITCRGPQPTNSNVTQLNFGNVTVSTQSSTKVVWFELISGAVSMATVKFSLQSHGSFQHHDQGGNDTEFHFGTVGAGNDAPGAGATSNSQTEFTVDSDGLGTIDATDIDQDSAPTYLSATKQDLAVVASADLAQTIGNYLGAPVSDFVYLAIKLGANETGANSTINYRMFFDFE